MKLLDTDGTLLEMNPAGLRLIEADRPEHALGTNFFDLIAPKSHEAFRSMHRRVCDGSSAERLEFELITLKGNKRWMETCAVPFHDELKGRTIYLAITRDIGARKRAAEELERAVADRTKSLKQANAQLEEFSYSISHDLRAPLRSIEGYAGLLLNDYPEQLGEDAKLYVGRIQRSSTRMQRMVDDLLALSCVSSGDVKLERVSTASVVHEIIEEQTRFQPPNADIHIGSLWDIRGHPLLLHQALSNLLGNAVKFVKQGVQPQVRFWSERIGNTVRICIQDNGVGVMPEFQSKLFGLFQRVHQNSEFEGTGVGLAIVRRCVERMGGAVGMSSDGENGSTFWIDLLSFDDEIVK